MAKYNASKHTIESNDGRTFATLTDFVETSQAWEIADWWGGNHDEVEQLNSDITNANFLLEKANDAAASAQSELASANEEIETARRIIAEIKAELAAAKGEGDA